VADCAVIAVPDERAGELPKAFIQKSVATSTNQSDDLLAEELFQFVKDLKARHKWISGGVAFVEAIPKSPAGKILRRVLREQEREARRKNGASL
jgi:acyl-coenzyme A synthetase/AMP-(fatty) acid ligase